MATQNNDFLVVSRGINAGGGGDDTYVLSNTTIDANAEITITDIEGANKIQFVGGLEIVSSIVASNTMQLTLNNGAVITVLGADTFSFETGGAVLAPASTGLSFNEFSTTILGIPVPTSGVAEGGVSVVNDDGTATAMPETVDLIAPIVTTAAASYAENSAEGTVVFTISADPVETNAVYSIESGNDNAFYAIDAATGEISLTQIGSASAANDFEAVTGETTATNAFTLGVKVTDASGNMSDVVDIILSVTNVDDTVETSSKTINISASDSTSYQAIDSVAETFVYEIDSSEYVIESRETGDIIIQGFNKNEDNLVFQDASNSTTSVFTFYEDALIESGEDIKIIFDSIIDSNDDFSVSEEGFLLTLVGITDLSDLNFSIA